MSKFVITDTDFAVASAKIASVTVDGVRIFNELSKERLELSIIFWKENEYVFLRNALTDGAILLLMEQITYEDMSCVNEVRQFYRVHNDSKCNPFIFNFLVACCKYYSAVLSTQLSTAYGFSMKYVRDSDMSPRYDNFNNPISSTVCYHFFPEHLSNPIFVDRARFENPYTHRVTVSDREGIPVENVAELNLRAGDIAVFRGRNHLHWRKFVADDMDYRALLLHYNDYKYKGALINGTDQLPLIDPKLLDFDNYDEFRRQYAMYFDAEGQQWI